MKGQLSVEHLVIVGLSLVVIIPATFLLLKYAESTSDMVNSEKIKNIGDILVYNGRNVYYKGPGNLISVDLVLPDVIKNITLSSGSELVIGYRTLQGPSQAVFFLDFNAVGPNNLGEDIVIERSGIVTFVISSNTAGVVQYQVK